MPYKIPVFRFIAKATLLAFLANFWALPQASGESFTIPAPGRMVSLSPPFSPVILKGIKLEANNPFRFHFFVDKGEGTISQEALKAESSRLIKYFLASITTPEKDLWVNLSPYEKDRIVPNEFGHTEMGRDLLAQDYLLKQITASLIYPEGELGKKFWKEVYAKTQAQFGSTNIRINTFNKVWIVPEKAIIYENNGTAFVKENHLKVILEQDYLASKHAGSAQEVEGIQNIGPQIVREIVIPALTKEVNEGKNFAQLRQVFYSLILATWYKSQIKNSIINNVLADQNKIQGVDVSIEDKHAIYKQYLDSFKKGVYSYIKEEPDLSGQLIPRKYFSGGVNATHFSDMAMTYTKQIKNSDIERLHLTDVVADLAMKSTSRTDAAINSEQVLSTIRRLQEDDKRRAQVLLKAAKADDVFTKRLFASLDQLIEHRKKIVDDIFEGLSYEDLAGRKGAFRPFIDRLKGFQKNLKQDSYLYKDDAEKQEIFLRLVEHNIKDAVLPLDYLRVRNEVLLERVQVNIQLLESNIGRYSISELRENIERSFNEYIMEALIFASLQTSGDIEANYERLQSLLDKFQASMGLIVVKKASSLPIIAGSAFTALPQGYIEGARFHYLLNDDLELEYLIDSLKTLSSHILYQMSNYTIPGRKNGWGDLMEVLSKDFIREQDEIDYYLIFYKLNFLLMKYHDLLKDSSPSAQLKKSRIAEAVMIALAADPEVFLNSQGSDIMQKFFVSARIKKEDPVKYDLNETKQMMEHFYFLLNLNAQTLSNDMDQFDPAKISYSILNSVFLRPGAIVQRNFDIRFDHMSNWKGGFSFEEVISSIASQEDLNYRRQRFNTFIDYERKNSKPFSNFRMEFFNGYEDKFYSAAALFQRIRKSLADSAMISLDIGNRFKAQYYLFLEQKFGIQRARVFPSDIAKTIQQVIKEDNLPFPVWIFGSVVKKGERQGHDIDLAIPPQYWGEQKHKIIMFKYDLQKAFRKKFFIETRLHIVSTQQQSLYGGNFDFLRYGRVLRVDSRSVLRFTNKNNVLEQFKMDDEAMDAKGGIDLNPDQMKLETKQRGPSFHYDFNGQGIDPAMVVGATFEIKEMLPISNLSLVLGLSTDN